MFRVLSLFGILHCLPRFRVRAVFAAVASGIFRLIVFALMVTLFSVGCVFIHFLYFCRVSLSLFSPYYICSMDNFGKTVTVQPLTPLSCDVLHRQLCCQASLLTYARRPFIVFSFSREGEVAVSPEPSGAQKISTRKSRAARFSPMEGLAAIRQHSWTPNLLW